MFNLFDLFSLFKQLPQMGPTNRGPGPFDEGGFFDILFKTIVLAAVLPGIILIVWMLLIFVFAKLGLAATSAWMLSVFGTLLGT